MPVSRYFEALLLGEHFERLDDEKQREILRRARKYKLETKHRGYPKYLSMPLIGAEVVMRHYGTYYRRYRRYRRIRKLDAVSHAN